MKTIQQTTPALRFKDEQGNDYPDWEQSKLGNIGTTFNGLTGKNSTHFGKGKPYIQYLQVFENSRIDVDEFGFVEIGENESQNKVCSGDVFFTTSSETPNEVGTASVLIDEVENTFLNSFCFGYRVNKEYLLPEYARFAFRASSFRKKVMPLAQGSTRFNLSKTSLMKIMTNLPSIEEQQIIASFLSSTDTKIEQLGKKKTLLKQYKKGIMQKLFSQEIRFKDEQGKDYPDWEEVRASQIFTSHTNKKHNSDLPILAATQDRGVIPRNETGLEIQSSARSIASYKVIEPGDFVISLRSFQGGIEYSEYHGIGSPAYTVLKPIVEIISNFFRFYFKKKDFISRLNNTIIGIRDGKQIPYSDFAAMKLCVPSLKEQQKIAAFLSSIDKKIELVTEQLKQARIFKKGLLQQMFI